MSLLQGCFSKPQCRSRVVFAALKNLVMSESPEPNKHLPLDVLKNYLIYTTSQPIPQISETLGTRRCILRIIQLMAAAGNRRDIFILGAFATIFYTSIANTPSSLRVYKSGVTMMTFTSIIGFVIFMTN
jgi:hypothetical protein